MPDEKLLASLSAPMFQALNDAGITMERLAQQLSEEMNATEVKAFSNNGDVIYSEPLRAWKIQQEARKDAHKLLNHYPIQEVRHSGSVDLSSLTAEEMDWFRALKDRMSDE